MKININDRVIVIDNNGKLRKGIINKINRIEREVKYWIELDDYPNSLIFLGAKNIVPLQIGGKQC